MIKTDEKVLVNEKVANILSRIERYNKYESIFAKTKLFLVDNELGIDWDTTEKWFEENGITIADVQRAFENGWVVEKNIEVGDIVRQVSYGSLYCVVEEAGEEYDVLLKDVIANYNDFELVCKRGDRKDVS